MGPMKYVFIKDNKSKENWKAYEFRKELLYFFQKLSDAELEKVKLLRMALTKNLSRAIIQEGSVRAVKGVA